MRRSIKIVLLLGSVMATALFAAWVTSPDPKGNPASFEDAPLHARIAPLEQAITLATYKTETDQVASILVTGFDGEAVTGVDLRSLGSAGTGDPLADLASIDPAKITQDALAKSDRITLGLDQLLPAAPSGTRHIGTGTNFPEHAAEANSGSVFQFPKFGTATPARTTIRARRGILLDYEVELCMRFDRDIASLADFDAAMKGVFLCGDFTDRNALVELADPDNLDSGYGFSDAKSGQGAYPSGPFLVVPRDWKGFVDTLRMTTNVNGERRQDARGREMTMDFRQLVAKALGDMKEPRFLYRGEFYRLAEGSRIARDMTIMSGTSEGTIFTPPSRADYIEGVLAYLIAGGPVSDTGLVKAVKQRFIANELESGHFLQPGDVVRHQSNWLGDIEIRVVGE